MKNKYIIIGIFFVIVITISSILILKFKKEDRENIEETTTINKRNFSKKELESLTIDDYKNYNMPYLEEFDLDEVDTFYYYGMRFEPGKYKENATRKEREKIYKYHNNLKKAMLEMCKKNGDWTLILNKHIVYAGERDGKDYYYNDKDGLLEDFKYNEISEIRENETIDKDYIYIQAKDNKVERVYRISYYIEDGEILNVKVKLIEEKDIKTNKNTNKNLRYFNENNIRENFNILCRDGDINDISGEKYGEDIAVSDYFRSKYKYFLDLFIHYSPLEYNSITLLDLDIENKTATFEVDSLLECKKRIYECKYEFTNELQLDDVDVKLMREENIKTKSDRMAQVFYKNSCWENIDLTDKFKSKYTNENGVFPNIDKLDNNFSFNREKGMFDLIRFELNSKKYQIRKFKILNEWKYYIWYYVLDKENKLDDVIYKELVYKNCLNLEEAKEKFLADKELQKELGID